jgi:hypothetical protein
VCAQIAVLLFLQLPCCCLHCKCFLPLLLLLLLVLVLLQVIPSQGMSVLPGHSFTLCIAVADANHGLVDSVLMLPAGAVRLVAGPTAAAGGPYAVVSTCCCLGLGWQRAPLGGWYHNS